MAVRWGIVGLGNIAHRFASDLVNQATNAVLQAVASRDSKRSQQFAMQYGCESAYGDYLSLVRDPDVDCIYVSTIHPQHRNVVELCLSHGKHVLVEKPAFTTQHDWDEMARLAQKNNLLMAEAMKSVTFPAYRKLIDFLLSNAVTLTSVEASFAGVQPFDPQNRLFNPQLGGGATLDVAVYPLWLFHDLCRWSNTAVPELNASLSNRYPGSQVEDHAEFSVSGALSASLCGSLSQQRPRHAKLKGENVDITICDKWWNPGRIEIRYLGKELVFAEPIRGEGFSYEIEHISALIIQGKTQSEWLPAEISRQVIQLMEESIANFSKPL